MSQVVGVGGGGVGRGGVCSSLKFLGSTLVLSPGFGADPTALLDKLSALTLLKAHPVPLTATTTKKVSFISDEIPSVEQEGGTLVIRSSSLRSRPGWKTADGGGRSAARSAWQAEPRRT